MRTYAVLILVGAVLTYFMMPGMASSKLPDLKVTNTYGKTVSIRDLGGKDFGVILYFSLGCPESVNTAVGNAGAWRHISQSPKYRPFLVYNDIGIEKAQEFSEEHDVPVLVDTGHKIGKAIGFHRYGILIYDDGGNVVKSIHNRGLIDNFGVVQYLDDVRPFRLRDLF